MKTVSQREGGETTTYSPSPEYQTPEVNIFETKEGYVVEAEMPGVNKDGLDITIDGNELSIIGKRASETVTGEALLHERTGRDFRRVFEIDPAIDSARISAKMGQGVLTLTLPRSERVKPRKVTVTG